MAKILVLAPTGFGKSSSIINNPMLGINGLNPAETFIISATTKPLPGAGTKKLFPAIPSFTMNTQASELLKDYRRVILTGGAINNPKLAAQALKLIAKSAKIKNVVFDDFNYIMQDWYMKKSLSTGWDAPKMIGNLMGEIFEAIEALPESMNFIAMAHYEEYQKADGRLGMRMKTTGKMVQEYITPEGKFDVVLFGHSSFDETTKKAIKEFVTNDDGVYSSAKSPAGMFGKLYIPNDLGIVVKRAFEYYEEGLVEEYEQQTTTETTTQEEVVKETQEEKSPDGEE